MKRSANAAYCSRICNPLLKPEHFIGATTSLTPRGLSFRAAIGHQEREGEVLTSDSEVFVERFAARRPSLCVVNPRVPSAAALKRKMEDAQSTSTDSDLMLDFDYCGLGSYSYSWSATTDSDGFTFEGQRVAVVCYDSKQVVGCAGLGVHVVRQLGDAEVRLALTADLVYVVPSRRGEGFGMDLSVACGLLVQDVLHALYRAVPTRAVLAATVRADYESAGGEAFTTHLRDCLDVQLDMLREYGKRRSVQIGGCVLDAGY
jgi:hypothetical protein